MSHYQPKMMTFKAEADLSAKQFSFVKFGTVDDSVVGCAVAGEKAIGILMNAPALGELAEVAVFGGAKVKLSGTVARGGEVSVTVTAGTGKAAVATEYVSAIAMASGVAGDVIPVNLLTYKI